MLEPTRVLAYLSDAMSLGNGPSVSFDGSASQWTVSFQTIAEGQLGLDLTRAILSTYTALHPDVTFGERAIPLAFSLRTLVSESGQPQAPQPLLCMYGLLDPNGRILIGSEHGSWIPRERIATGDTRDSVLTVCDLDAYRVHQRALNSLGATESWPLAVMRALDLFASVDATDERTLEALGLRIEEDTCFVRIWEHPDEAQSVSHALRSMSEDVTERGIEALSTPVRRLFGEDSSTPPGDVAEDPLSDDKLLSYKLRCGMLDYPSRLSESDHEALSNLARQQGGSVTCLQAPKGSNAGAIAVAAMANLLTEHALRGESAPTMACVGTAEQLETLLGPHAKRPAMGQVSPLSRWLPRIAGDERAGGMQDRKVLGAMTSPFLLHSSDGAGILAQKTWPTQQYAHILASAAARYAAPWYLGQANIYYLDCASGYLDARVRSPREAIALLSERLRTIDQTRCDLIDAYADICRADELIRRRDLIVNKLIGLRHAHKYCRDRLEHWTRLAAQYPQKGNIVGGTQVNQQAIIAQAAQPKERLAQDKLMLTDVCLAYQQEIDRIESDIDRMRGASATLSHRARIVAPESGRCAELVGRLCSLCKLNVSQRGLLESVIDGRQVSMAYLDHVLDQTIRPTEFWLAVHVNESRWLTKCMRSDATARLATEGGHGAWSAWANFCPLALVPDRMAASVIMSHAGGEHGIASSRLDYLVVLNADELDVPTGTTLLGLANTALCVGTSATLGPQNPRGVTFDELYGKPDFGQDVWHDLRERHLLSSGSASFYEALRTSGDVVQAKLVDTHYAYGELCDTRVDLLPDEYARTTRTPANSADDAGYAMAGIMPVLSYVLVPDSAWGPTGSSKENRSEALALFRWLANHGDELKGRMPRHGTPPICLLAPYDAQVRLLSRNLEDNVEQGRIPAGLVEVHAMSEIAGNDWPVVLFCGTCGPDTLQADAQTGFESLMGLAVSAATDAFVLVCGGSWLRSGTLAATHLMRRLTRIGRLFSVPRTQHGATGDANQPQATMLREKPLSLTMLLQRMAQRGDIAKVADASQVNKALDRIGLIERTRDEAGNLGWRPTAAGREIGIVGTKDRNGNQFCSYGRTAEAVIATIVSTLDTE